MVQLRADKIARAVAVNHLHKIGPLARLNEALGRHRGGIQRWRTSDDHIYAFIGHVFRLIRPFAGDLAGKVAVEIGPGDNVGVAYSFVREGCAKVIAVERISSITLDERAAGVLRGLDERIRAAAPTFDTVVRREGGRYLLDPRRLEIRQGTIETLELGHEVDLIYSNDVMEHVDDPLAVFRAARRLLKPGGRFISNIDLSGHNGFASAARPLDFLTCEDWLWRLMFSDVVTTNRVRFGEFVAAVKESGLSVAGLKVVRRADPAYLAEVRPHLLPRYRALPDDDLGVVQCVLVAQKD